MNKRQKIVVSITGITLVLLILVGLTYAYFLTRIQGNTNTKSISVTTADLRIVYVDGTQNIITKQKIQPGEVIGEKDFTVTNEGNSEADYIVVIDDVAITNVTSGDTTTFSSNDFVYTLTCVSKNKNTNEVSGTCDGVSDETTLPLTDNSLLISNKIAENMMHVYVLTVTYKETGIDQSEDMNKKLEAKVDIKDIKTINPYTNGTLAYSIINNSMLNKNGTELRARPLTKPAEEIISSWGTGKYDNEIIATNSLCSEFYPWLVADTEAGASSGSAVGSYNDAVGKYVYDQCSGWTKYLESYDATNETLSFRTELLDYEKELSIASDDYGTSYYYRGAVEDNYVNFAGMCWRIVRVEGDGSVKLILEDQDTTCFSSVGNWDIPTTTGGSTLTGFFGYTQYASGTLTASNGTTTNSSARYVMNYLNGTTNSARSMATAFKNFQSGTLTTNIASNYGGSSLSDYLKIDNWCMNDKGYASETGGTVLTSSEMLDRKVSGQQFYYDTYIRLYGGEENTTYRPTFKCNGTIMTDFKDNVSNPTPMYVATLTADEVAYAGGKAMTSSGNYYLINWQNVESDSLSLLSPNSFNGTYDEIYVLGNKGYILNPESSVGVNGNDTCFRPAITLKSNITISSGEGTKTSPYVIN